MNVNRNKATSPQAQKEKKLISTIPKHVETKRFETVNTVDRECSISVSTKIPIVSPDKIGYATKSTSTLGSITTKDTLSEQNHSITDASTITLQTNSSATCTLPSKTNRHRPPRPPIMSKKDKMEKCQLLSPPRVETFKRSNRSDNANTSASSSIHEINIHRPDSPPEIPISGRCMPILPTGCHKLQNFHNSNDHDSNGFSSYVAISDDDDDDDDEGIYFSFNKKCTISPPKRQESITSITTRRPSLLPRVVGGGSCSFININPQLRSSKNLQLPSLDLDQNCNMIYCESDLSLSSSSSEEDNNNMGRGRAKARVTQMNHPAIFQIACDTSSGEGDVKGKKHSRGNSSVKPHDLLSYSSSSGDSRNRRMRHNGSSSPRKRLAFRQRTIPKNKPCNKIQKNQQTLEQNDDDNRRRHCYQSGATIVQEANSPNKPSSKYYGTATTTATSFNNHDISPDGVSEIFQESVSNLVSDTSTDLKSISSLSVSGGSGIFNYSDDDSFSFYLLE